MGKGARKRELQVGICSEQLTFTLKHTHSTSTTHKGDHNPEGHAVRTFARTVVLKALSGTSCSITR